MAQKKDTRNKRLRNLSMKASASVRLISAFSWVPSLLSGMESNLSPNSERFQQKFQPRVFSLPSGLDFRSTLVREGKGWYFLCRIELISLHLNRQVLQGDSEFGCTLRLAPSGTEKNITVGLRSDNRLGTSQILRYSSVPSSSPLISSRGLSWSFPSLSFTSNSIFFSTSESF